MQNYTVRVMMTNYNQFAMMFFKKVHDNYEFFKISLYGGSSPAALGTAVPFMLGMKTPIPPRPQGPPYSEPLGGVRGIFPQVCAYPSHEEGL